MRRLLTGFVCLLAAAVFGASSQVVSVTVETNGWVADVLITSASAPASGSYLSNTTGFDFGLGANNNPSASKVVFSVTSPGFDDSGVSNTVSRTIYATHVLRLPWPNNTNADCTVSGSDIIARVALSHYVCSNDVLTASVAASLYNSNVATNGLAVSNASTNFYPKALANWTWPGYQRVTNGTMTLRATGFHRSGQQGRPIRVMRFVAQDQHSHAVTNWVTDMVCDVGAGDATPICEYIANMDVSGMTSGDLVRCDFTAYPWVGDGNAVLSTFDNANAMPTPLYASITNKLDWTFGYAGPYGAWAVVATGGNDSTGVAVTNAPSAASPPAAFATINGAMLALQGTNSAKFGHSDLGGSTIYLTEGDWAFVGGTGTTYTNTPDTWVTLTRWITNTVDQVRVASQSGRFRMSSKDHIFGLTITSTNISSGTFSGATNIWVDRCIVNSSNFNSGHLFQGSYCAYWTGNTVTNMKGGMRAYSTANMSYAIVRGNLLNSETNAFNYPYTFVGNLRTATNYQYTPWVKNEFNGQGTPKSSGSIIAYNRCYGWTGNDLALYLNYSSNETFGIAIVQNVFEQYAGAQPTFGIAADSTTSPAVNNILEWNNTIVGQRVNEAYNEKTAGVLTRYGWQWLNNLEDDWNIKTDTFNDSSAHQSGARIGNWPAVYGVETRGNAFGNINTIGAVGFSHAGTTGVNTDNAGGFAGMNTWETETAAALGYYKFLTLGSFDGTSAKLGNGDYRIRTDSPAAVWNCDWVLPYDIAGVRRGPTDPPGAYATGNPRRSAMTTGF